MTGGLAGRAPGADVSWCHHPRPEAVAMLRYLRTLRDERRQLGWRGLLRKRGWKLVLLVVAYYLVRDTILYIVIPIAIAAGVLKR
jgi:hypothetical protein